MATPSFWDHPIDKLEEALNLKKQIHALQAKLSSMFSSDDGGEAPKRRPGRPPKNPAAVAAPKPAKRGGKRVFSAESRAKMAAAQQARWARKKGSSPVVKAVALASSATRSAAKKGKRTVSPEVRARLAAAMKARWAAAKKKGLPGPNARK